MFDEADSRLSGGLADGETRVFHGLAADPLPVSGDLPAGIVTRIVPLAVNYLAMEAR